MRRPRRRSRPGSRASWPPSGAATRPGSARRSSRSARRPAATSSTDPRIRRLVFVLPSSDRVGIIRTVGVNTVGIVGAGTMGQGIATVCAGAGLDVLLADRTAEIAARAVAEIGEELDRDIAKWRHTASEKKAILGRLKPVDGLPAL